MKEFCKIVLLYSFAGSLTPANAAPPETDLDRFPKPPANRIDTPFAKSFSMARAGEFLDLAAMGWLRDRECASCHTSYPYLMARPMLGDRKVDAFVRMRSYLEERVSGWDRGGKKKGLPAEDDEAVTEIVATAATLAFDDAQSTQKLHPLTRQALDRMWTVQRNDGSWNWNKHDLPPQEYDEYYGVVYAALGVGFAPEQYFQSEFAKIGISKIQTYLKVNPAPNLHHQIWLAWASIRFENIMSKDEREKVIQKAVAMQGKDGGWSSATLGNWKRHDGSFNNRTSPSDGYATGLILYVFNQTGMGKDHPSIQKGIKWLKSNQRETGGWFTESLSNEHAHYNSNAGTAYAVMALKAFKE